MTHNLFFISDIDPDTIDGYNYVCKLAFLAICHVLNIEDIEDVGR